MADELLINGRFLSGGPTAVNSVAGQLSKAICDEGHAQNRRVSLVVPKELETAAAARKLPVKVWGWRSGIAWEQLDLPSARSQGHVAGFFNTVPLMGCGYITLLHDAHVFTSPNSYPTAVRFWRRRLAHQAGSKGNLLLTVSHDARRRLLHHGVGDPSCIGVVANGLGDIQYAVPDETVFQHLGLRTTDHFVVSVGNVLPHKNLKTLLQALSRPELSHIRLVLTGDITPEQITARGWAMPNRLICSGHLPVERLSALMRGAVAVCVPSLQEGFGLPVIEAMFCGAPVIISNCTALPEVGGSVAVRCPPFASAVWADSVLALASDPERRTVLGRAGRQRAEQFTWSSSAQDFWTHVKSFEETGRAAQSALNYGVRQE